MTYVTSDLHGYPLAHFKKLLSKADLSDKDICYILGDVIDRGSESIGLLKWITEQPNIRLLRGNHEDMMIGCSFLFKSDKARQTPDEKQIAAYELWMSNGGRQTLKELKEYSDEETAMLIKYIKNAPLYKDITVNGQEYLLVHGGLGGFDPRKKLEEYSSDDIIWERPKKDQLYFKDITTILGHTPTHYYGEEHCGMAYRTPTWINIDTGAACGGAPMLLRLEDLKEFYIA